LSVHFMNAVALQLIISPQNCFLRDVGIGSKLTFCNPPGGAILILSVHIAPIKINPNG